MNGSSCHGEFKIRAEETILRLKAGDSLLVQCEMPHAFVKTSDGDARLIVMHQRAARMEGLLFRLFSKRNAQSHTSAKAIGEQYGMRSLGPGLASD
jgi:uncharacterized cupin superfamily protein